MFPNKKESNILFDVCNVCCYPQIRAKKLKSSNSRPMPSTAEIKILIIFFYYLLLTLYVVVVSIITASELGSFTRDVTMNFLCEANGVEASCSKANFNKYDGVSKVLGKTLIGTYPFILILFCVQLKGFTDKIKKVRLSNVKK